MMSRWLKPTFWPCGGWIGKIVLLGSVYYPLLSHLCKSAVSAKMCDHRSQRILLWFSTLRKFTDVQTHSGWYCHVAMLESTRKERVSEDCIFAPQLHIALLVNLYSFHVLHVIVCVCVFGCHFLSCFWPPYKEKPKWADDWLLSPQPLWT